MQRLYIVSYSSLVTQSSLSSSTSYTGKDGVSYDSHGLKLNTYPDDELDISDGWSASKELQSAGNVHIGDLVEVFSLHGVPS